MKNAIPKNKLLLIIFNQSVLTCTASETTLNFHWCHHNNVGGEKRQISFSFLLLLLDSGWLEILYFQEGGTLEWTLWLCVCLWMSPRMTIFTFSFSTLLNVCVCYSTHTHAHAKRKIIINYYKSIVDHTPTMWLHSGTLCPLFMIHLIADGSSSSVLNFTLWNASRFKNKFDCKLCLTSSCLSTHGVMFLTTRRSGSCLNKAEIFPTPPHFFFSSFLVNWYKNKQSLFGNCKNAESFLWGVGLGVGVGLG